MGSFLAYSQVPNKRGVLIDSGVGKIPKFNKQGAKVNAGLEFGKSFKVQKQVVINRKEQKQVVMTHATLFCCENWA